jgi:NAD(P)-dependent dehydrogenase (short-subunit alcohol dehydrogenase family)
MELTTRRSAAWLAGGFLAAYGLRGVLRSSRRFDVQNAVVLITGGSRGLGLLLARQFGAEHARVVLCARSEDDLARAQEDLHRRGVEALVHRCDVTDREQVSRMISHVERQWGPIDVLVNNAGIIEVGPLESMTVDDFERAMQVHYWGPLYASMAALPAMRRRGSGRIVNIVSFGGKLSVPHLLPYCGSKFALAGFSEGLRSAVRKDGIYVTSVFPGPMRTGSPINAKFKGRHRAEFAWFVLADSIPQLSIGGERAARKIVEACRYGEAEVVLTLPARLATVLRGIVPGVTSELLAVVDRMLPSANGSGTKPVPGRYSRPDSLPRWATALTDRAARNNNEL